MSLATVTLFAQYVGRHKKILTVRHTAPQVPVPVIRHWARGARGCPVYRYMLMHLACRVWAHASGTAHVGPWGMNEPNLT